MGGEGGGRRVKWEVEARMGTESRRQADWEPEERAREGERDGEVEAVPAESCALLYGVLLMSVSLFLLIASLYNSILLTLRREN